MEHSCDFVSCDSPYRLQGYRERTDQQMSAQVLSNEAQLSAFNPKVNYLESLRPKWLGWCMDCGGAHALSGCLSLLNHQHNIN